MEKISIKIEFIRVFIFNCMCDALGNDDACSVNHTKNRNEIKFRVLTLIN